MTAPDLYPGTPKQVEYQWICSTPPHGHSCQCSVNLRKQSDAWRLEIAESNPDPKDRILKPTVYNYPVEPCPYCGTACECDMVDIGIGLAQCGPYWCERCGASEMGPEMASMDSSQFEMLTGWYEPGRPVSPYANTVGGVLVDHKSAKLAYDVGLLDEKLVLDK